MVKQSPHPGAVHSKNGSHPGAVKRAMRRVEQARASYARAEARVVTLRVRLARAEEKLTRRVARLSAAEESLATLAAPPGLDAPGPPTVPDEVAAVVAQEDQRDPVTGDPGAATLTAPAAHEAPSSDGATTPGNAATEPSSDGATTPADVAPEPAATAQSAAPAAGARRSRSRRKPSGQGES